MGAFRQHLQMHSSQVFITHISTGRRRRAGVIGNNECHAPQLEAAGFVFGVNI